MRTWTIVANALSPAAYREACALAARGKDLVLIGPVRAELEVLAAELRVVHRVDVRILALDLARDAESAVRWLRDRDRNVDGIVAAGCGEELRRGVKLLAAAFLPEMKRHGLGTVRCVEEDGRERRASVPLFAIPPRQRTTTQRGWADPQR